MNEETNKEWQSTAVAENVQEIDLIIDGNSSEPLEDKVVVKDTVIIQTGENLMNIGVLKIDFDAPRRDGGENILQAYKKRGYCYGRRCCSSNEGRKKAVPLNL